jgi:hypothetical protein
MPDSTLNRRSVALYVAKPTQFSYPQETAECLKNPVSWLETESLYHSYTTRGEAQEVANGIDRMISDGAPVSQSKLFPRPKHSSALSDTAFGS